MIVSDLNYLESAKAVAVVGGFNSAYGNVYFNEYVNVDKKFRSNVDVKGYAATAESDAQAYGYKGAVAQIFTATYTTPGYAEAQGTSISFSS
ncbi:MAG: hypothetical protein C4288_20215 [Leptolyngbya sp. ERB_1_1]